MTNKDKKYYEIALRKMLEPINIDNKEADEDIRERIKRLEESDAIRRHNEKVKELLGWIFVFIILSCMLIGIWYFK
jgi:hypothetical protein